MHLVLKKVQFLHFLTWNKSPLSIYNISHFFIFGYFFLLKTTKNVHFLIKIHILGRNALNCALYLEFNVIFCDPDGLLFNKKVKRQNIWEKEYYDYFKEVDKRCDIYLFNILTLALIQKRSWSTIKHMDIGFKNNELSKILSFINDFKESNYDCSYMIDYLPENEKEFKKLTKSF